ncbi:MULTISPECIES: cell division protein ZapA [Oceanospirillaceae]|mgnify:FL=1|uniref:Cell division protein ZapA n=1 Tax=Oceanobacter antarcticus TaxID=3133425 RepID=A0ABW8NHK5_9GAMM
MANDPRILNLTILEREYRINCPAGAEQQLRDAARLLDQKMVEIKNATSASGKVPGTDRIAVIAALNIAHQLLEMQSELDQQASIFEDLNTRLDSALNLSIQREL